MDCNVAFGTRSMERVSSYWVSAFFPLLNGNVTNLPSANRIPFPPSEYIRNAANVNAAVSKLGGADNYQTKVWWQRRDK